jgi:hypothetical protein
MYIGTSLDRIPCLTLDSEKKRKKTTVITDIYLGLVVIFMWVEHKDGCQINPVRGLSSHC